MPFSRTNSQFAASMRARLQGLHRAAFWAEQGYPNLQRAWAARKRNAALRREAKLAQQALEAEQAPTRYRNSKKPLV